MLFWVVGSEYFPEDDTDRLTIRVELDIGTRVEETAEVRRIIPLALEAAVKGKSAITPCVVEGGVAPPDAYRPGSIAVGWFARTRENRQPSDAPCDQERWPEVVKVSTTAGGMGPGMAPSLLKSR